MPRIALAMGPLFAFATAVAASLSVANAEPSADSRVADLVQAGKIRVGVGVVGPHWAVKNPSTGELKGLGIDLARALASRIGVELMPVEYASPPRVLDGLRDSAWDLGFLGIDTTRAEVVDFSPAILQMDATYLVRPGSSVYKISDADLQGMRVAVPQNTVEQFVLAPLLARAELVPAETFAAGFELLRAGKVEALAAIRPMLLQGANRLPGSRVLEDRFHVTLGAMAVPKGKAGRLAYISEFIEEAKASGLVHRAIGEAGLRGVQVAPSDRARSQ
jgi:polar amino acid transport system substrate-binding protein